MSTSEPLQLASPSGAATKRLTLSPLQVTDAAEMAAVLADPALHQFIGGRPATRAELRRRYDQLAAGSPDPLEVWINWVIRRWADDRAVGYVQATLTRRPAGWSAELAWVVGVPWQHQGYATEAARALLEWCLEQGVDDVVAHVHPDHRASSAVAARIGLRPTAERRDGEVAWHWSPSPD
jgi:RimJ/RimL family protein N-acetyltransferase